jgi:hypothetical protein
MQGTVQYDAVVKASYEGDPKINICRGGFNSNANEAKAMTCCMNCRTVLLSSASALNRAFRGPPGATHTYDNTAH